MRRADKVGDQIFVDGNSAAALGCVYGGATVAAWYPITPSSSVAEAFQKYCAKFRVDPATGQNRYAIVQAEDEIASIGMVVGAGWNGARAFTATSGPGVSLMTEFIGLAYFAEIPVTIINVQRGGPSTGMPTRTQQADILACAYASHGDTKHVLLFPEDPHECFEHAARGAGPGRPAADAGVPDDRPGHRHEPAPVPALRLGRGPRLRPRQGDDAPRNWRPGKDFGRYKDVDGDGIPWRTLPGTHPTKGSYFTRGTTRDPYARYSERGPDYIYNVERLLKKFATAADAGAAAGAAAGRRARRRLGVIYFGSTSPAMHEALDVLAAPGHPRWTRMRLRAFPFPRQRGAVHRRARARCSWWSRTATRRCAACWSTSSTSIRPGWCGCCTSTARRSPRASSRSAITEHVHAEAVAPQRKPGRKLHDLHRQAARCAIPTLETNKVGYTRRDYEGKVSTLCAGCGHDSISAAIIQACWELDIEPHRVAKLSGIGCSSKTPDYFLGASHGFNTVHGRMPSVLTGANLANRDLLYLGVSGDGDSASIGLGQFAHAMRRGVRMAYIVENNGVYGLTKGQFSATADQGSKSKKGVDQQRQPGRPGGHGAAAGRHLRRARLLGQQGAAGAADQGRDGHGGAAFIDVISPCVAFNNHPGSTKSYDYVREHNEAVSRIDFITPRERDHRAGRARAKWWTCASTTARCCGCAACTPTTTRRTATPP